jgi:hypothetical protein
LFPTEGISSGRAGLGVGFNEKPTAPGFIDWRTGFDVSVDVEYSGRVACSTGVLFENSIVCLVVF